VIDVKDDFLERKLPELLPEARRSIPRDQLLQAFLTVNRDVASRRGNQADAGGQDAAAAALGRLSSLQPRNTKVFSNFAETRTYRYHGRQVDTQVHFGYDLAAVRHGPGAAANAGVVVFAGPLSIYGNTVIVDHGLGLQTLYAHLSTIEVRKAIGFGRSRTWDARATPARHGRSPALRVLIGGISVTPVEWWMRDGSATTSVGRCGRRACSSSSRSCRAGEGAGRAAAPPSSRGHRVPPSQPTTKAESP